MNVKGWIVVVLLVGVIGVWSTATASAASPSDIPIYGSPSDTDTYTVYVALHQFAPWELDKVQAVMFANAGLHGSLRYDAGEYRVINRPLGPGWTVCGEAWGFAGWAVIVDDWRNCGPLTTYRVIHEVCHLVVGVRHEHDVVWSACMAAHGA